MADDEKPKNPDPDEVRKTLEGLFSKFQSAMPADFASGFPGMEEAEPSSPEPVEESDELLDFNYLPRDIKAHLDRFVIRQDEAKKALAIAVCDHYNHAKTMRLVGKGESEGMPEGFEFQKQNVMVVGPTGVGKTYLVKHIADLIGVPFVKADATKFSETGYVGGDVDDLVRELVQKADGDVRKAEYGIIYIDEIDKLASRGGMIGRDVSGRGVQTTLLKLMEETEVPLRNPNDMRGQMMMMMDMQRGKGSDKETISTKHILFIVSGAFSGLEKVVRKRTREGQIGFGADLSESVMDGELFRHVNTGDFIDFGFEAEFIGRLPVRVVCEQLTANDLESILKYSEGSLLRQYEKEFEAYGVEVKFKDSGIEKIAALAAEEKTGARALMTVMERLLRDFKYELPGTPATDLVVDAELLENREERLAEYRQLGLKLDVERAAQEVGVFIKGFQERHGVLLELEEEAVARLVVLASEQGRGVLQVAKRLFHDYQHGLKLIQRSTNQKKFVIPPAAVDSPDKWLSEQVLASYRGGETAEKSE